MEIRNKLTFQFAVLVGSILLTFSIIIYASSASYRKQEFHQRLKERAVNTAKLLIDVKEIDNELLRIIDSTNYTLLIGNEVVVFDYFKKSRIYSSTDSSSLLIDEELLSKIRTQGEYYFRQGDREAVGLLYSNDFRRFVVISSAFDIYGITKLQNLTLVLAIGFFASIFLTIITGLFFSRQALKPILNVISQVSSITATNLNKRVDEGNGYDEIARLAITFNKMLNRIETAFNLQKEFVSNASHELRTPLASITSQVEVVLLNKRKESEYREVLGSVLDEARGLTNLANNLLEIARSGQELSTMNVDKVRLDELLLQSQSELSIRNPECIIDIDILDNSGNEDHDFSVMGNENLLKLIFVNLIDNACKFSNNKPVNVTVDFRKNDAKLSFEDQGIGIPEEDLDHIFEPFFRARNAQTKKGHGIGLSLIANIIKLHKGSISIKSEVGKGTLIEVYLPYKLD